MIASIATAVLPVWRSPMISSRWPRPTGTMESMDFRARSRTGWSTDLRDHAGATFSITSVILALIGPLPSIRLAQRVDHAADQLRGRRALPGCGPCTDGVAFGDVLVLAQNHGADGIALEVQTPGRGSVAVRRGGNSSISPCITSDRP